MASLEAYAAGLTAETLTDVVIAKLAHLPPREAWAGADVPAAAGASALAGFMQVRMLRHLAVACQPMHLCRIVSALSCSTLLPAMWLTKKVHGGPSSKCIHRGHGGRAGAGRSSTACGFDRRAGGASGCCCKPAWSGQCARRCAACSGRSARPAWSTFSVGSNASAAISSS